MARHEELIAAHEARSARALEMGGAKKLAARKAEGRLLSLGPWALSAHGRCKGFLLGLMCRLLDVWVD